MAAGSGLACLRTNEQSSYYVVCTIYVAVILCTGVKITVRNLLLINCQIEELVMTNVAHTYCR